MNFLYFFCFVGYLAVIIADNYKNFQIEKLERKKYLENISLFTAGNEIDTTGFWEEDSPELKQDKLEQLRIAREEADEAYTKALDQLNSEKGYRL